MVKYNTADRYKKWFKVVSLTQITDPSSITSENDYVIQNNTTKGYLYDNGNRIAPTSTISYNPLFFFKFESSGTGYKIKNTSTDDYVRRNNNTLNISDKDPDNATEFSLEEDGDLFRIHVDNSSYWVFQRSNSAEVSSRNQDNRSYWIIYLVDDSGIGELPSS